MNRQQRRTDKHSHRLPLQTSVLWIPEAGAYLSRFSPEGFTLIDRPELAQHYEEDRASIAALNFRKVTGLKAAVRPYYNFQ
ncbi:MAG TPA: hypothetical protein VMV48_00345 [Gallionellaceae bacterium]|nr:hypothetical protein [Gallionellaceae bacterium]